MASNNQQFVSDVIRIMQLAIGRPNSNDPASSQSTLIKYINDFKCLFMPDDVKLIENYGTLSFVIDDTNTTGVYDVSEVDPTGIFVNYNIEAFISLTEPENNSVSWNFLPIFYDPGQFFSIWGINNEEILVKGYPTMMLYYGDQFTFRTIQDKSYTINMYGYKSTAEFKVPNDPLEYSYWVRYLAYGAACDYARDFRYEPSVKRELQSDFSHYRKYLMARAHNTIKLGRCLPRF